MQIYYSDIHIQGRGAISSKILLLFLYLLASLRGSLSL